MVKIVAFDLEISKQIPEGTKDWSKLRPFGISCAATVTDEKAKVWHGAFSGDRYAEKMSIEDVGTLAAYLWHLYRTGYFVVTWNGLSFDFSVLAEEGPPETVEMCKEMAMNHIDIGFLQVCEKGYMIGLNKAAHGFGLGKMEGMDGALAPKLWAGSPEDQRKVLSYVRQDSLVTFEVYQNILEKGCVRWLSRKGAWSQWCPAVHYEMRGEANGDVAPEMFRERLLTVKEALEIPEPYTGWMREPRSRRSYYEWIKT